MDGETGELSVRGALDREVLAGQNYIMTIQVRSSGHLGCRHHVGTGCYSLFTSRIVHEMVGTVLDQVIKVITDDITPRAIGEKLMEDRHFVNMDSQLLALLSGYMFGNVGHLEYSVRSLRHIAARKGLPAGKATFIDRCFSPAVDRRSY